MIAAGRSSINDVGYLEEGGRSEPQGSLCQAMALSNIQGRLAAILAAEEVSSVDWSTIDRLCDELDRELDASDEDVPEIVNHFLSDSDIRARDARYGETQREAIRTYLRTGDYFDGVALPWWSCLALLVVASSVVVWAVV